MEKAWIIASEDDGSLYAMRVEVQPLDGSYEVYGLELPITDAGYAATRIMGGMCVAFGKNQFLPDETFSIRDFTQDIVRDTKNIKQPEGKYHTRCRLCKLTFKNDIRTGKCLSCGTATDELN